MDAQTAESVKDGDGPRAVTAEQLAKLSRDVMERVRREMVRTEIEELAETIFLRMMDRYPSSAPSVAFSAAERFVEYRHQRRLRINQELQRLDQKTQRPVAPRGMPAPMFRGDGPDEDPDGGVMDDLRMDIGPVGFGGGRPLAMPHTSGPIAPPYAAPEGATAKTQFPTAMDGMDGMDATDGSLCEGRR